ncbi:hypothetical protein ACISK3_04405 [Morganella morganii]|nr:hypothetical protein [Morganella morganii]
MPEFFRENGILLMQPACLRMHFFMHCGYGSHGGCDHNQHNEKGPAEQEEKNMSGHNIVK